MARIVSGSAQTCVAWNLTNRQCHSQVLSLEKLRFHHVCRIIIFVILLCPPYCYEEAYVFWGEVHMLARHVKYLEK